MQESCNRNGNVRVQPVGDPKLVDLRALAKGSFAQIPLSMICRPIEKLLALDTLNHIFARFCKGLDTCNTPREVFRQALDACMVDFELGSDDLERIPQKGPLVVVSNHPFGGIEGIILGELLYRVRQDVAIVGNYLLKKIPGICDSIISVDPFATGESVKSNLAGLRQSLEWLKNGGALIVFPAGEVSSFQLRKRKIVDPVWSPHVGGLIRRAKAAALPIFFPGRNGLMFQSLGFLHPRLRTAMLPRELTNKSGKNIQLYVGKAIPSRNLRKFDSDSAIVDYLRLSTYFLKNRGNKKNRMLPLIPVPKPAAGEKAPVVSPVSRSLLESDLASLPQDQQLATNAEFAVYLAQAPQIPNLLREIGRLRELTFREVQEGTGNSIDLDEFDRYYLHLFLWNHEKRELVGAYRLGLTDDIIRQKGPTGLYTNQLFLFKPGFLSRLANSIELGRSFIRIEYQKKFNSLMLLWKGIGEFIARNPRYRILFGPVSISKDYHTVSRYLLVRFLKTHKFDLSLSRFVAPRKRYRTRRVEGISRHILETSFQDIDDISLLISEIEKDGKGIPVLLKHYLNLNGNLICFNVDKAFSDVVDGLFMVDLTTTDPRLLKRFMGESGLERFIEHNGHIVFQEQAPGERPAAGARSGKMEPDNGEEAA